MRSRYSMKEIVVQHDVTRMRGYSSSKKKKQRTCLQYSSLEVRELHHLPYLDEVSETKKYLIHDRESDLTFSNTSTLEYIYYSYVDEEEEMSRLKISSTNLHDEPEDYDDDDEGEESPLPMEREEFHGDEPIVCSLRF